MVNDWDLVVHQKQLFKLPAKVSVNHIIEQYLNHLKRQEMPAGKRSIAMEVIRGIGEYFNVSLGPQLLYGVEKVQYKEVSWHPVTVLWNIMYLWRSVKEPVIQLMSTALLICCD